MRKKKPPYLQSFTPTSATGEGPDFIPPHNSCSFFFFPISSSGVRGKWNFLPACSEVVHMGQRILRQGPRAQLAQWLRHNFGFDVTYIGAENRKFSDPWATRKIVLGSSQMSTHSDNVESLPILPPMEIYCLHLDGPCKEWGRNLGVVEA